MLKFKCKIPAPKGSNRVSLPVARDTEYSDKQQNMASLEGRVLVGGSVTYSSTQSQPRPQLKVTGRRLSRPDRLTPRQSHYLPAAVLARLEYSVVFLVNTP